MNKTSDRGSHSDPEVPTEADFKFAKLVFDSARSRLSIPTCYEIAFPGDAKKLSEIRIRNKSYELHKSPKIQKLLEAMREEALSEVKDSARMFIDTVSDRAIEPIDRFAHLPHHLVERRDAKGAPLGYVPVYYVNDPRELPDSLLRYVKEFVYNPDEGIFEVVPRDTVDSKTRAKYVDMLGRATGQYTDKLEVTGANGGPVESVTTDMDPIKAAEIYKRAMKRS